MNGNAKPNETSVSAADPADFDLIMLVITHLATLAEQVDRISPHTREHSSMVADLAEQLARQAEVEPEAVRGVRSAARLQNLGVIAVPTEILTKQGELTPAEFDLIRVHPQVGAAIVDRLVPSLQPVAACIRHHHENWDGTGYPDALAGEDIPIGARIIRVADAIAAMVHARSYKDSYTTEKVLDELRRGAAKQFDPAIVDAALAWAAQNPDAMTDLAGGND
jgi:response regulator RpfG family c-di-GMP phosphodiesterase